MTKVISSVKALLEHNGKHLFLKEELRKGEIWDLPGGKIEYGETPIQALKREIKEELNIDISVKQSVGLWYFYSLNQKHQVICHTYLCVPKSGFKIDTSNNPSDEQFVELRWMTIDEILSSKEVVIHESLRELLENLEIRAR